METMKERNDNGSPLNNNWKTFKEYKDMANNFNTYFTNKNVKMSVNNLPTVDLALNYIHEVFIRPFPYVQSAPVTTKEITEITKSLPWKNSHGYYEIQMRILKISLPLLYPPLYIYIYVYMQ
jgi:hypothetical protein